MGASSAREGVVHEILRLLQPQPGRLEFALRLALIAVLTTLIVQTYGTFFPALAVYVILFLNKSDRATSLVLNVGALVAVSVLVALMLPLAITVIDRPVWRMAVMAGLSLLVLYLASARGAHAPGGIIALILAFALSLMGMAPVGEAATRALLYAWLIVAIPAAVSIVINLLLAPSPRRQAERALACRLRLAASMLAGTDLDTQRTFRDTLNAGDEQIRTWLKLAKVEHTSRPADLIALQRGTDSTVAILVSVDMLAAEPAAALLPGTRHAVVDALSRMASMLEKGGYPIDVEADFAAVDSPAATPAAAAALAQLERALAGYAEPAAEEPDADAGTVQASGAAAKSKPSLLSELLGNPTHIRYAVKTTAAAMFCYLVYTLLNYPGIHTAMITCYIVALATTAETAKKIVLRMTGAVIGGILGMAALIFLLPSMNSVVPLLALIFVGMLVASWIAIGDERIAYAGFQIAFAFLLCVLQGPGIGYDLGVARDRVIGVLLGNLVVYVIFTRIWPVSIATRIDAAIATALRHLEVLLAAPGGAARLGQLAHLQSGVGSLTRDLDLTAYEPASVRPARRRVHARRRIVARLHTLQQLAFCAQPRDAVANATIKQRLDGLIARFDAAHGAETAAATANIRSEPPEAGAIARELGHIEAIAVRAARYEGGRHDAVLD